MKRIIGYEVADFRGRDNEPVHGTRVYWSDGDLSRSGLTGSVCGSIWIPSKYVPSDLAIGYGIEVWYSRGGKPCKIEVIKDAPNL